MKLAFASNDGIVVNQHFGHTPAFWIIEINEETKAWRLIGKRVNSPSCSCGEHDESVVKSSVDLISDCHAVFAVQAGNYVHSYLQQIGLKLIEVKGFIKDVTEGYIIYLNKVHYFEKKAKTQKAPLPMEHPCFNNSVHGKKGRLHLPVSPSCNIQCKFCIRACNKGEQRPGVANGILRAEEAVDTVRRALELCPEITVVGIAGPGDTLATGHGLEAFRLVHEAYPQLIKCLSTNGLALPGKIPELLRVGVRTITVTVNAVNPKIGEKIYSHILWEGKRYTGEEAAAILSEQQLKGIREATENGIHVKINTVLIPGVNEEHIGEIAEAVKAAGASLHNIIPLIPQHDMKDIPAPSCEQINKARNIAEQYLPQFRHCMHCRADACGIIGKEDLSYKLYGERRLETFSHG